LPKKSLFGSISNASNDYFADFKRLKKMPKLWIYFCLLTTLVICLINFEVISAEVASSNSADVLFLDNESRDISKRDIFSSNKKRRRKAKNLNLNNPGEKTEHSQSIFV
jgi:hypothetical protein